MHGLELLEVYTASLLSDSDVVGLSSLKALKHVVEFLGCKPFEMNITMLGSFDAQSTLRSSAKVPGIQKKFFCALGTFQMLEGRYRCQNIFVT